MALIIGKDQKGRRVSIHVQPMRGALLSVIVSGRDDRTLANVEVALTPDDCRLLAADLAEGGKR